MRIVIIEGIILTPQQKILKQQAIANHRMTSKLEHLHGFASIN